MLAIMNKIKRFTHKENAIILVGLGILGMAVCWLLYDKAWVGLIFMFALKPVKKVWVELKSSKGKREVESQFYDFLYFISTSLSLGRTMMQSIEEAKDNLIEIYGNRQLVQDLETILKKNRESNIDEKDLLKELAEKNENEDMHDFFEVYEKCKTTGGDLIEAVNGAAQVIREKIEIEKEIKAMSKQSVLEGRIISAFPFAIILFLKVTGPDYLQVMYETPGGRVIMTMTLLATIVSWVLVEKFTKVRL